MVDEKESPAARQRRLAAALRDNLQKRKAQQRTRGGSGATVAGPIGAGSPGVRIDTRDGGRAGEAQGGDDGSPPAAAPSGGGKPRRPPDSA